MAHRAGLPTLACPGTRAASAGTLLHLRPTPSIANTLRSGRCQAAGEPSQAAWRRGVSSLRGGHPAARERGHRVGDRLEAQQAEAVAVPYRNERHQPPVHNAFHGALAQYRLGAGFGGRTARPRKEMEREPADLEI